MTQTLLSLGHGYSAAALAARVLPLGWRVLGTTRKPERAELLRAQGVTPLIVGTDDIAAAVHQATHLLSSAGPSAEGDPFLPLLAPAIEAAPNLSWIGYLSTTGVYGDRGGDWVDEDSETNPESARGQWRLAAEQDWRALGGHIFRLAGIYGPGRGPFSKVRSGQARRIIKPGQVFGRIHADDIAQIVAASMARPNPGQIYNCSDDMPAPPQDVIGYAAQLLGLPLPPEEPFETAEMSPMARSFYAANRRVRNTRIKSELGVRLLYPDYKVGLRDLLKREQAESAQ
ncbi:MAG: SDR family oxidoreductase [Oceanicola sp.]|nr:SDR family oxidoreductase [Oceanicola sp.]